ncbi:MAG: TRAP transporter substrate-binding protein [Kiloniellales bacterium]|nr:TRAP transporter substrate-binding protein [Kiloniellales bacterium]
MSEPIKIRFGGYSPADSTHNLAAVRFKEALAGRVADAVQVEHYWNVMDFGYRADDLLAMVECGLLTMCYFSTSYLASRVPELEVIDLPFVFEDEAHAHAALDGALGAFLTEKIESRINYRVLGYWDNGFRHLTNRLRPVRTPQDLKGMRVRLQPNDIHSKAFELLGAVPVPTDLKPGIAMIQSGEVDAQENPLANTVTYGVDKHHQYVTMSAHLYGARGVFVHKTSFDAWPENVQKAVREAAREAIAFQRELAAAKEHELRAALEKQGIAFVDLTPKERTAFTEAVQPLLKEARQRLGNEVMAMAETIRQC